jgi:hypothetical protein
MCGELIPLSVLALDLPVPAAGWPDELVVLDDVGRPSVDVSVARSLLAEARERQEVAARKRAEIEQEAVEKDRQFRASLPAGVPAGQVPEGISAGMLMMLSDSERQGSRRETVLEHALQHRDGAIVYHPINEDAS